VPEIGFLGRRGEHDDRNGSEAPGPAFDEFCNTLEPVDLRQFSIRRTSTAASNARKGAAADTDSPAPRRRPRTPTIGFATPWPRSAAKRQLDVVGVVFREQDGSYRPSIMRRAPWAART